MFNLLFKIIGPVVCLSIFSASALAKSDLEDILSFDYTVTSYIQDGQQVAEVNGDASITDISFEINRTTQVYDFCAYILPHNYICIDTVGLYEGPRGSTKVLSNVIADTVDGWKIEATSEFGTCLVTRETIFKKVDSNTIKINQNAGLCSGKKVTREVILQRNL